MRLLACLVVVGCGPAPRPDSASADAPAPDASELIPDSAPDPCELPLAADVELAPAFAGFYRVHDLGPVPGIPDPLGGTVIRTGDNNTLLVAGGSESDSGAIYS